MRLLIFLLALSSAFFVSKSQALELDMDDLVVPEPFGDIFYTCKIANSQFSDSPSIKSCYENNIDSFVSQYASGEGCPNDYTKLEQGSDYIEFYVSVFSRKIGDNCKYNNFNFYARISNPKESESTRCPPRGSLDYIHEVFIGTNNDIKMCAKEKNDCPEPTDNDPFVFGTGGQTEKCFKNSDGTQCKIQTDDTGGYYIPISYGSAEPVQCARAPDKEVDKTSPPEEKPAPEDTDDGAEMNELDALNKINDNLDAMNENQVAASDSNDERLDRVSEEIQIGNEILGEIRYNTDLIESNTDDTNDLLGETNGLLADILDNTGGPPDGGGDEPCTGDDCEEGETFTITAERKNAEKGLNSIFTDEQRQVITDEIDEKKQEIEDYFEQIESESSSLFDINPSLGGGYEERIEVIKGVEVDMGLGRLASFFQLIAAAVMLCSTLTALYILLGP